MASLPSALNLATVPSSSINNSRRHPGQVAAAAAANRTCDSVVIANPQASLYQVLGIPMGATGDEIKAAYRRLARVLHPDVNGGGSGGEGRGTGSTITADEFMSIHEAYTILRDAKKRADYDRTLFRQRRTGRSPWVLSAGNGYSGYTRRTWETDQCW